VRHSLLDDSKKRNKRLIQKLKNKKKAKKTVSTNKLKFQLDKLHSKIDEYFDEDYEYDIIMDSQELYDYLTKGEIYGLDTESDTINEPNPLVDTMVGFSAYSRENEKAIYVPTKHKKTHLITHDYKYDYSKQLSEEEVKEVMQEVDSKFVLHTATYDSRVFLNSTGYFNFDSIIWDVFLASIYLNELEKHGLKALYDKYVKGSGKESLGFKELFEDLDFSIVPLDLAKLYAGKDAVMTLELYYFQLEHLHPEGKYTEEHELKDAGHFFVNWEVPLIKPVAMMEERGMNFDYEYSQKLKEKYVEKLNTIEKRIHDFFDKLDFSKLPREKKDKLGEPVNIASPQQISIILYDVLGLDYESRTTDVDCLKHFAGKLHGDKKKFFEDMLEYRTVSKLISTYIDNLPELVHEDGKIHTRLHQMGARTGRFSSSDPNLQNIPKKNKEIRRMFTAEKGKVLICSDYSQQEPRVLAYISGDEKMIERYQQDRNLDLYSLVASIIFEVPYNSCLKGAENEKFRTLCKAILLGIMYGRSIGSVAESLGKSYKDTKKLLDEINRRFPGIESAIRGATRFCEDKGFVQTIHGRKRRLPDIHLPKFEVFAKDEGKRQEYLTKLWNTNSFKEIQRLKNQAKAEGIHIKDNTGFIAKAKRQAINSIIQGSSADMIKKSIVMIEDNQDLKNLGYELLLTVHDEVIGQIPFEWDKIEKAKTIITDIMVRAGEPVTVPMKVDHEVQFRWNGKKLKPEGE